MKKILYLVVISLLILTGCNNAKDEWAENKFTSGLKKPEFEQLIYEYKDDTRIDLEYSNVEIEDLKLYIDEVRKVFPNFNSIEDTYEKDKNYKFVGENENYIITIDFKDGNLKITIV